MARLRHSPILALSLRKKMCSLSRRSGRSTSSLVFRTTINSRSGQVWRRNVARMSGSSQVRLVGTTAVPRRGRCGTVDAAASPRMAAAWSAVQTWLRITSRYNVSHRRSRTQNALYIRRRRIRSPGENTRSRAFRIVLSVGGSPNITGIAPEAIASSASSSSSPMVRRLVPGMITIPACCKSIRC